jgi:hypothetical protein
MLLSEREKLFSEEKKTIGLGISKEGKPYDVLPIPWDKTSNAFNMRTPNIYIAPEDLQNQEIMSQIAKKKVDGCYIFEELKDYTFLKDFTEIRDLYIRKGKNIKDLSFMSEMKKWYMLLLEDVKLDHLDELYPPVGVKPPQFGYCMAFYHCDIKDVSALKEKNLYMSELIIWNKKTDEDYNKWKNAARGKFTYYDDQEE